MRRSLLALFAFALAACASPPTQPPADTANASITLERTRCFGFCPDYSVTVRGDGQVIYQGRAFVGVEGERRAEVSPQAAAALFARAEAIGFVNLRDEYRANITDIPSARVTLVTPDGRTKSVLDYGGEAVGMPASVRALQDEIDRVAGTNRWVPRPAGAPATR